MTAQVPHPPARAAWRFASNLVMRPLKKALQARATPQMLAYLPVLLMLNAAYAAGVAHGMSRGEPAATSDAVPARRAYGSA